MAQNRSMDQLIDEQINRWRILTQRSRAKADACVPVVCVSREAGTLGKDVARSIADRLSLAFFDREIIERVAKSAHKSEKVIEALDDRARLDLNNWVEMLITDRSLTPDQYVEHLTRVIGAIGQQGNAVILGRGAGFILPPDRCFRVRCVAPFAARVRTWAADRGVTEEEAERLVRETDEERRSFVRRAFGADYRDPLHYDVVINTERIDPKAAGETIVFAMRSAGLLPVEMRRATGT